MYRHSIESCIRGFHVYKATWSPTIGEQLSCKRERNNTKDRYAVKVVKPRSEDIVGHLPRTISTAASLFIRNGGTVHCCVTGSRRYSSDLVQGGMEIPCQITFTCGERKPMKKLKQILNDRL